MAAKLSEYNQKRDFEKTAEPEGEKSAETLVEIENEKIFETPVESLNFVVQHHIARRDHYDFRIEWKGVLLSWAIPKGPSYNPNDKRLAVQVEDHPFEYRNFEGTIPKGQYGGGAVMLWDEGIWIPVSDDVDEGLRKGVLKFTLNGKRLKGNWALIRLNEKEKINEENWILLKEKDEYAQKTDGISQFDHSVRTGRNMEEIESGKEKEFIKNPFESVEVMLAKLVDAPPKSDNWIYEIKYDGYRIVAFTEGNNTRLITRNGNDYTNRFYNIASSINEWADGRAIILDGEMVIADKEGKSDFQALQNYMKNPKGNVLTYIVFDILALDGNDLRKRGLSERKEILSSLMKNAPENLFYSKCFEGNGEEILIAACNLNLEGIMGKKAHSFYSGTRNGDWIKIKCDKRQEFVIGGYTLSDKKTSGVSSLLLGFYEDGNLVYAGRAGTGITERSMKELEKKFEKIIIDNTPFIMAPKPKKNEKIIWLKPQFIGEIKFAEWTEDNLLRQASFKGLRIDKNPEEVIMEKPAIDEYKEQTHIENNKKSEEIDSGSIMGIKITNPDKIIFENSEIKKIDVVKYYSEISERMMPYISKRILSLVRCPKGTAGECFFKKHPDTFGKGINIIPIMTNSGAQEEYFYIENPLGLISEAQMGTLEFHTWASSVDNLEKPDIMVFDLDPDEGMDLSRVRQGVTDLKNILEQLSLISFLKTSGGKGYHVVVPFKPSADWNTFYAFSRRIAEVMEKQWPEMYTSNIRKNKRTGRIFIDWGRNGRGATSIAPYSLRARKIASVSMPIAWEELDKIAPNEISMTDAIMRIKKDDPWKDFFKMNQQLKI